MKMTDVLLTVNQLYKEYRNNFIDYKALKGIDFILKKSEFVAIMGPSGSGKTTFLQNISTIDRPTSGVVNINGQNPFLLNDAKLAQFRRSELGFVFQDFNLVDTLTVEENILLPLVLDSVDLKTMNKKLEKIVSLLGISRLLKKRIYEISGGERQRAAIARAVIHEPSLLLADEPTGNLDSKAVNDVMSLFQFIHKKFQTSLIVATHDAYVASFADRVIFIRDGSLYNEIQRGSNREKFYQEIMDTLAFLGGGQHDF